jgi:hypothetical protein
MSWLRKIAAFQLLSRTPGGKKLYYAAQRNLTRSNIPTRDRFLKKAVVAMRYLQWLEGHTPKDWLTRVSHLDFGAGWLPSVPLLFYALGSERQYLADIHEHMTADHVRGTIGVLREVAAELGHPLRRLPELPEATQSREAMLAALGITYAAPPDALLATLPGELGIITATDMLLHLNRATMKSIFQHLFSLLAPGGYFLAQTPMLQLFGDLQHQMPPELVFRLPEWAWENLFNSRLMGYSRLKGPDYRAVLEEAGFAIRDFEVRAGSPEQIAKMRAFRPHPCFAHLTPEDLAADHLFFIAQKPA